MYSYVHCTARVQHIHVLLVNMYRRTENELLILSWQTTYTSKGNQLKMSYLFFLGKQRVQAKEINPHTIFFSVSTWHKKGNNIVQRTRKKKYCFTQCTRKKKVTIYFSKRERRGRSIDHKILLPLLQFLQDNQTKKTDYRNILQFSYEIILSSQLVKINQMPNNQTTWFNLC